MQLSVKALALTIGILWGGAILFVGIVSLFFPGYADEFLRIVSSFYPGFDHSGSLGDLLVGTVYGLVDGAIGGVVIAWLYNLFARRIG